MRTRVTILPVAIAGRTRVPMAVMTAIVTAVIVVDIYDPWWRVHGSVVPRVSVVATRRWVISVAIAVVHGR